MRENHVAVFRFPESVTKRVGKIRQSCAVQYNKRQSNNNKLSIRLSFRSMGDPHTQQRANLLQCPASS